MARGLGSLNDDVSKKETAFTGISPQALETIKQVGTPGMKSPVDFASTARTMPRGVTPSLLDALVAEKILKKYKAAERDMILKTRSDARSVKDKNMEEVFSKTLLETTEEIAKTNRAQKAKADKRLLKLMNEGIAKAPVKRTSKMMNGGIVGYQEGSEVVGSEIYDQPGLQKDIFKTIEENFGITPKQIKEAAALGLGALLTVGPGRVFRGVKSGATGAFNLGKRLLGKKPTPTGTTSTPKSRLFNRKNLGRLAQVGGGIGALGYGLGILGGDEESGVGPTTTTEPVGPAATPTGAIEELAGAKETAQTVAQTPSNERFKKLLYMLSQARQPGDIARAGAIYDSAKESKEFQKEKLRVEAELKNRMLSADETNQLISQYSKMNEFLVDITQTQDIQIIDMDISTLTAKIAEREKDGKDAEKFIKQKAQKEKERKKLIQSKVDAINPKFFGLYEAMGNKISDIFSGYVNTNLGGFTGAKQIN